MNHIKDFLISCVQLSDADMHDYALDGLRQIMAIKSRAVLPYLIPQVSCVN